MWYFNIHVYVPYFPWNIKFWRYPLLPCVGVWYTLLLTLKSHNCFGMKGEIIFIDLLLSYQDRVLPCFSYSEKFLVGFTKFWHFSNYPRLSYVLFGSVWLLYSPPLINNLPVCNPKRYNPNHLWWFLCNI